MNNKQYCDCGSVLVFEKRIAVLDSYDDKFLVCNKYYCPRCGDEYEINEEISCSDMVTPYLLKEK